MASSSQRPLTPGGQNRKSRRSWFDTPPLTSLDPPKPVQDENAVPISKPKPKRRSLDTVETLTLTHFTNAPRLGFGQAVTGGRTKFRTLLIRNPHDYEQEVIIEKFPFKKKFYVDHTRFYVPAGEVFSLEMTWSPEEAGGVREMVQFHIDSVYRLQCYLFGTADNPKPVRKTRRRRIAPHMSENKNSTVIQTPALTRIKSSYNPRRSQEIRDVQALVENKALRHDNIQHNDIIKGHDYHDGKLECQTPSTPMWEKEGNHQTDIFPQPIATPTVLESTSIGLKLEEEASSSSSHKTIHNKWRKTVSGKDDDNDNDDMLMRMSPIPTISDGHDHDDNGHGMTVDSFFRPSEIGTGIGVDRLKIIDGNEMKNTFVVPKAPSQFEIDSTRSRFSPFSPNDSRLSTNVTMTTAANGGNRNTFLSSTICVSSSGRDDRETTYNVVPEAVLTNPQTETKTKTFKSTKEGLEVLENYTNATCSPSSTSTMERSKRMDWQSPNNRSISMNFSDSASPNTILDQSLSFITQASTTPAKIQQSASCDEDLDASLATPKNNDNSSSNNSYSLVSPNTFVEEMKKMRHDDDIVERNDIENRLFGDKIPSPSAVFNNSIPHEFMTRHLDSINLSLMSNPNSPLGQPKPLLKGKKCATKRRSLTRAYRIEEKKQSLPDQKHPPKVVDDKERRSIGKMMYERERGRQAVENLSRNPAVVDSPRRGTFVVQKTGNSVKRVCAVTKRGSPNKKSPLGRRHGSQHTRRRSGGKYFSPKMSRKTSKRHSDCSTPVNQTLETVKSDTIVKNSSYNNSFGSLSSSGGASGFVDHKDVLSPNFTAISPNCLSNIPGVAADVSSRRSTLTVTKSRPSDALLAAVLNNNKKKKLFDGESIDSMPQSCVRFEEMCNTTVAFNQNQQCHNMSGSSPSNQFCSPTNQNLPNSPKLENSRRSTHVVKSPKVLDLSSIHQKRLNFDDGSPLEMGTCNNNSYHSLSLSEEIASQQDGPITSVCIMSPGVVDYEITSEEEGSNSRQSISVDSLNTSNQRGDLLTIPMPPTPGGKCENRVDFKPDKEGEITFTSLKLKPPSNREIDWSFCEMGDTKVLPETEILDDAASSGTCDFVEMDGKNAEVDESCQGYGMVDVKEEVSLIDSCRLKRNLSLNSEKGPENQTMEEMMMITTTEMPGFLAPTNFAPEVCIELSTKNLQQELKVKEREKRKLRRSVSANEMLSLDLIADCHNEEADFPHDNEKSNTVIKEERIRRKRVAATDQDKLVRSRNETRLRSSVVANNCDKGKHVKSLGSRSQSLSNVSNSSNDGVKGCSKRVGLEHARAATSKVIKNTDKTISSVKSGAFKPKKGKGMVPGVAQSKLILVKKAKHATPRHPMPFAARNMYYDERWMEKQEAGFVQWLNFVLTPPDEYVAVTTKPKVDAVALTLGNQHNVQPRLAPTKEVLSFRAYAARRRLNRLRRAACNLYQSEEVVRVIHKIEVEVESKRLAARKDRMLHADLGIKQRVLDLLLQYSSLWLRTGLETVFGEVIPLHSNTDVVGLSRFVVTRLLACPDIAATYAHPSVPHLYTEGFAPALSRHTVKKFLLLIYFMDRAKTLRLIDHDPCLFCKDADIKSSKEILIQFSREVLSGEGDLTRHLAYLGYTVCQVQKPFDEFDYAVTKVSTDLKDGLRLSRLLELLASDSCIMGKLRTPAISRLQKIHNMEAFFSAMAQRGLKLEEMCGSTARDVVDGHREKTLAVLWNLILHFQANLEVDEDKLKEEIHLLTKSLQLKLAMQKIGACFTQECLARRDSGESTTFAANQRMQLIFRWCRLVCLHYGVRIENMTVSFSDGRALCCLLHHYHPSLLPLSEVRFQTSQQFQEAAEDVCDVDDPDLSVDWGKKGGLCPNEDDPAYFEKLLANERSNFKVLYEKVSALGGVPLMVRHTYMSNTIPDEKVVSTYVAYLCLRLLDIRQEVKAARVIQMAWRRRRLQRTFRERLRATLTIQKSYRKYLESKRAKERLEEEERICQMESAAIRLQATFRRFRERRRLVKSAIVAQSLWRRKKAERVVANMRLEKERMEKEERLRQENVSAVVIQKVYRGFKVREEIKRMKTNKCAVVLQCFWRMQVAKRVLKAKQIENKSAMIFQKHVRGWLCRREIRRINSSALILQCFWRVQMAKRVFKGKQILWRQEIIEKKSAIIIQKHVRGWICQRQIKKMNKCAIVLQCFWRVIRAKKVLKAKQILWERDMNEKKSATTIQKHVRGWLCRREIRKMNKCAIILQSFWRTQMAKKVLKAKQILRKKEVIENKSATIIQKHVRGWICRKEFRKMNRCAVVLQCFWRVQLAKKVLKGKQHEYKSTTILQKHVRAWLCRREMRRLNSSALTLQCFWRVQMAKRVLIAKQNGNKSAVIIQKHIRGWFCRKEMSKMREASIFIQKSWRGCLGRKRTAALRLKQKQEREAAIVIQKWLCGWKCRQMFQQKRIAAICIQRMWRAVLIGRYLEQEEEKRQTAATRIQAWYKQQSYNQRYRSLKAAAMYVQTKYRSIQKGRKVREQFECIKRSVVTIQKGWRQFVVMREARRILEEKREMRAKREEEERKRKHTAAAILVQSCYKGYKCRQEFVKTKMACIQLQSLWRMEKAKRVVQTLRDKRMERATEMVGKTLMAFYHARRFQKMKWAAILIQTNWRRVIAMRQLDSMRYLRREKAAVCIQLHFKAYKIRQEFLNLKRYVVILQTYWKCYLAQQELIRSEMVRKERERQRAACVIQAFVRGAIQRRIYLRLKNAAAVLQGFYQRNLDIKRQEQEWAACVIQSAFRRYVCYTRYRKQKEAAMVIQNWFRTLQKGEEERQKFVELRWSVITVQSYFKMKRDRKEYLRKREAVIKLQAFVRRTQAEEQFHLKRNAALIIQMYFRAWKMGRIFRQAFIVIRDSCIVIQRFYRSEKAKKEARVVELFNRQNEAAVKIQVWYKSCQERNAMKQLALEEEERLRVEYECKNSAATVVQQAYKNFKTIQEARMILVQKREDRRIEHEERQKEEKMNNEIAAALIIQNTWRQRRVIKEAKEILRGKREEATRLMEEERLKRDAAASVIQRAFKQFKLVQDAKTVLEMKKVTRRSDEEDRKRGEEERSRREEEDRWREKVELSATLIQKFWRKEKLGREAKLILKGLREAKVREEETERKLREEEEERKIILENLTASKCQAWYRMVIQKRKYRSMQTAALILQRKFCAVRRGRETRCEIQGWHLAAIVIQTAWRGVRERREARMVLEDLKEMVRIEEMARIEKERLKEEEEERVKEEEERVKEEERRIEEEDRLKEERRKEEEERVKEEERRIEEEDRLKKEEEQILKEEEERVKAEKRLLNEEERVKEEDNKKQEENRMNQAEKEEEKNNDRQVKAAQIIQRNVRAFLHSLQKQTNETDESSKSAATIVIQKYLRGYHQRCEYSKTLQAIVVIQSHIRANIQRRKWVAVRLSVCLVQRRWRERSLCQSLREEFLSKMAATRLIQAWYRRMRTAKRQTAVLKIQALWRGYIVRHRIKCKKLKAARQRLQEVSNSSDTKNTLAARTTMALEYLLANNDMAYILNALMNLEVSTRLSSVCCQRLVEANAVSILVKLMASCNRSVPHMEVIKCSSDILLNLAHYEKTVDSLMEVPNLPAVVLTVMQIYREKGPIFYKACSLLGILAQDSRRRQILLSCPNICDRVQSLHALALRKHRNNNNNRDRRLKTPAKTAAAACAIATTKATTKEFDNPLIAITFVMNSLQLSRKE